MHDVHRWWPRSLAVVAAAALFAGSLGGVVDARADDPTSAPTSGPTSAPTTGPTTPPTSVEDGTPSSQAGTDEPSVETTSPQPTRADRTSAEPSSGEPPSAASTGPATGTADGAAQPTVAVQAGDTIVGELVQAYDDPFPQSPDSAGYGDSAGGDPHGSEPLSWVQTAAGESVRVSTEDLADVPAGATIEVTVGDPVHAEASADGYAPSLDVRSAEVVEAPLPDQLTTAQTVAPVNHPVTVVMMQPAGAARDGTTLAQVVAAVDGPVGDFWEQQSGGVVRVGVSAAVDWFQGSTACATPTALWAEAAARANWTYAPGRHLLVYVPSGAPGCGYGLGEVRQDISSGGQIYVQATATSVIAHELGHNFGLQHSSELQCDRAVEELAGRPCQVAEYRDHYDVMGVSWRQVGTLNTLQASRLGVLPAAQRVDVASYSAAAQYALSPVSGTTGTRAVRLTADDGTTYWLEYRPPSGQDSWLSAGNDYQLESGVLLRRDGPPAGDDSLLLDATPTPSGGWPTDHAVTLPVGAPVAVGGVFTVTVVSAGATAVVTVRSSGVRFAPPAQVNVLSPGEGLADGGRLVSGTGAHSLVAQPDGNLVLYRSSGQPIWNTGTWGTTSYLVMQPDGNLVLYSRTGVALWHSRTWGNPGAWLVLQADGNVVVYSADHRPLWWTGSDIPPPPIVPAQLPAGQVLAPGQGLSSPRGRYRLVVQGDGNVVVYASDGRVLWHAGTNGSAGARAVMQADGNFVVYAPGGRPLWNSGTWGTPGSRLVLQDDGNLVVYRPNGVPAWWSNPDPRR